jgi:hypothetical protein
VQAVVCGLYPLPDQVKAWMQGFSQYPLLWLDMGDEGFPKLSRQQLAKSDFLDVSPLSFYTSLNWIYFQPKYIAKGETLQTWWPGYEMRLVRSWTDMKYGILELENASEYWIFATGNVRSPLPLTDREKSSRDYIRFAQRTLCRVSYFESHQAYLTAATLRVMQVDQNRLKLVNTMTA